MGRFRLAQAIRRAPSLGCLMLALSGCGIGGPAYDPVAPEVAATVNMTSTLVFSPQKVTIRKGDLVEWRNIAGFSHDISFEPEEDGVALPKGASGFESGRVPAGDIFRHRFTVPGSYRYVCTRYSEESMTGEIEVLP